MTREVAKICEKRAPKSNHCRVHAVLYSNTFNNNVNNVNNVSSLLSLFGFFFCFFFAGVSFITKATQCPGYIRLRKS